MSLRSTALGTALASLCLSACSTRQAYDGAQAWQQNECRKLPEQLERERCLQRHSTSHDSYEKQREAARP